MNKFQKIALAFLGVGTLASGWTAYEVTKFVENGLEITIEEKEADGLIEAAKAAEDAMADEGLIEEGE